MLIIPPDSSSSYSLSETVGSHPENQYEKKIDLSILVCTFDADAMVTTLLYHLVMAIYLLVPLFIVIL